MVVLNILNFLVYSLDEINRENNEIIECKTSVENESKLSYIIFSSGNQYTFKSDSNSIYKNNIKISEDVERL